MNKRVTWLSYIVCILIIIPVIYYCMHSIPFADDFANAKNSMDYCEKYGSFFVGALAVTAKSWLTWQGTYTGAFTCNFLNAYARWGLWGLRIANTLAVIILFFVIICLVRELCKYEQYASYIALIVNPIVLFWVVNNYNYREIYTWHTVIHVYVIPLAIMLFGVTFYIRYIREDGGAWIVASICAFCGAGGSLNISTLGCGLLLITLFYETHRRDTIKSFKKYIPICLCFAGTLVNVLAPGNFVRYDEDQHANIILVVVMALLNVLKRMLYMLTNTPYLMFLCIIIILFYRCNAHKLNSMITYSHPMLVGIMYILGCMLVNFPYCIGCNIDTLEHSFENRAFFVEDLSITLLSVLWAMYFAGFLRNKLKEFEFGESHYTITLVMLISTLFLTYNDMQIQYMLKDIISGNAHDYAKYQEQIIEEIRSGGDNVVIYYDAVSHQKTNPIILGLRLSDDEDRWDFWYNKAASRYFGKSKPIRIEYVE